MDVSLVLSPTCIKTSKEMLLLLSNNLPKHVFIPILYKDKYNIWELKKVNLIKFKYSFLEVEVIVNHVCEVYNSRMLNYFCRKFPDFRKFVMCVKSWIKSSELEKKNTLNSYTLSLMSLGFYLCEENLQEEA